MFTKRLLLNIVQQCSGLCKARFLGWNQNDFHIKSNFPRLQVFPQQQSWKTIDESGKVSPRPASFSRKEYKGDAFALSTPAWEGTIS